mgnify:CR=1 FL=1
MDGSFVNEREADSIVLLLQKMLKAGVSGDRIGVITPYVAQQLILTRLLFNTFKRLRNKMYEQVEEFLDKIEIASVDAFQGREKDYIILSLVRSNMEQNIGFLSDRRRMNVSLTRAKRGLIVVGNGPTFVRNEKWTDFIKYCVSYGVYCEGDTEHFIPCQFTVTILPIKKIEDDESNEGSNPPIESFE